MTRLNMFLSAAIEEISAKPVGVDAIHDLATLQPKPEIKKAEDYTGEQPVKAEVGEDHPFAEHDDIDTVAESQETTLALESLSAMANRYMAYGSALEEIADQVEGGLDAGKPLEPSAASLLTTAIDGAGIGEPLADSIALESFDFSLQAATESFIEDVKARAKKVFEAVGNFAKKTGEVVKRKLKRFADYFRTLPGIIAALEKEISATEGFAGRSFEDAALEKKVQKKFYAPSSVRNPVEIVKGSMDEYDAATSFVDGKYKADLAGLQRLVSDGSAEEVVAGMNKMLVTLKTYLKKNVADAKFTTFEVSNNLPEKFTVGSTSGMMVNALTWEGRKRSYDAPLKIAGAKDLAALKEVATRAQRLMNANSENFFFGSFEVKYGHRTNAKELGFIDNLKLVATYRSLCFSAVNVWAYGETAAAQGVYSNFFAATGWIRASIAQARALKKAD